MNNYEQGYFSIKNKAITELKANVFKTYCYLISKDFKGEGIWYSQQTIANDLGVSVRTVQRHIKVLKELGYISVKRRFSQTNIYKMLKNIVEKVKEKKEESISNFKNSFSDLPSKNRTKLKFNNFKGRDYSTEEMRDLELKLLGWK